LFAVAAAAAAAAVVRFLDIADVLFLDAAAVAENRFGSTFGARAPLGRVHLWGACTSGWRLNS
jgi:hypothetical protein